MENLTTIGNILKAAIGLGFVIFVHELGHFLLAKWNGVKVERFSIGFGRTLVSYRKGVGFRVGTGSRPPGPEDPPTYGETEYVLAALPLGGYVKMLGESLEDPSEVIDPTQPTNDPRSFNQKPVFARMQIITAGVIMNLILGMFCFAFVYSQGVTETATTIGAVLPGGPAYKAGLLPGDEIVAIDGLRDVSFKDLLQKVAYSGAGQKVNFTIKRAGSDAEKTLAIEPLRGKNYPMPTIGIQSSSGLELAPKFPFEFEPGQTGDPTNPRSGFEGDDKVIAIGGEGEPLESVTDYGQFIRKVDRLKDRPIVVEVERKKLVKDASGKEIEEKSTARVTVPVHRFLDFGLRLTPGPIAAIRNDSPAQKAGLKEGDQIVAVDGSKDYDPMELPSRARELAGKPWKLTIERPVEGKPAETLELTVTPDDSPAWVDPVDPILRPVPLDIPGLGLAIDVIPKIQAVADGSPAAKAGLKPGQVLRSIVIKPEKSKEAKSDPKAQTIDLSGKTSAWPLAFGVIQRVPLASIELILESSDQPISIKPEMSNNRFHPSRGLNFQGLQRKYPPLGLWLSLRKGFDETVENVSNVFSVFRNISQGRVGKDAFGGLPKIANAAYSSASAGWIPFIQFLGMLSVNLAVLNFLPIPPLDGGQFLFLAAEKIRGKPLPDWALNIFLFGGLIFVVALILFINGNDIYSLVKSYF